MTTQDTIIGLASGGLPSGIAVVRVSGGACQAILQALVDPLPKPRRAEYRTLKDPSDGSTIDHGLVLWFPGPGSFTGEDVVELQVHGGRAVVDKVLSTLLREDRVRLAEAGEFTRRAFENGRMDLTEVEGLADLIAANTEVQREIAVSQSHGALRAIYEGWRESLIRVQAMYAAEIDFIDEDDVPDDAAALALGTLETLSDAMRDFLADSKAGEIIRDGYRIAIMGPPNAGKSSLLNYLAKREIAIVTDIPGTTRDVLEVTLDIAGVPVVFSDTAGIRETVDPIEQEGIRRAYASAQAADLVIWLQDRDAKAGKPDETGHANEIHLLTKDDAGTLGEGKSISSVSGHGIGWLIQEISLKLATLKTAVEPGLITRRRHRDLVSNAAQHLEEALNQESLGAEVVAEHLRRSGDELGKLSGRIDVEDLLDVVFSEFCVGK